MSISAVDGPRWNGLDANSAVPTLRPIEVALPSRPRRAPIAGGARSLVLRAIAVMIAVAFTMILADLLPSPYSAARGFAEDVTACISLPNEHRRLAGTMSFTTVSVRTLSYLEAAGAALSPGTRVLLAMSSDDHRFISSTIAQGRALENSKASAITLALRRAGYTVDVELEGLFVDAIAADSPLRGVVEPGDVIVDVDGEPVHAASAFAARALRNGTPTKLRLGVLHASQRRTVTADIAARMPSDGRSVLGLVVESSVFGIRTPFDVDLKTGDRISGASAGLMFALGLFDALTSGDLSGGHHVAGTGTVSADGEVGPVVGVADKVRAAEAAHADVFIAPRANAEEAISAARHVRVIPVQTFDEAVDALRKLGGTAAGS